MFEFSTVDVFLQMLVQILTQIVQCIYLQQYLKEYIMAKNHNSNNNHNLHINHYNPIKNKNNDSHKTIIALQRSLIPALASLVLNRINCRIQEAHS
jgi:hypothetical protein